MLIEVYCDGSGNTFNSDGGYGFRIVVDGVLKHEGSGYLPKATNNVAELTAAVAGLEWVKSNMSGTLSQHNVYLVSDSQLVLGYASGAYKCKALHLTQLYIQLRKVYQEIKASGRWVKGHSGDEHNEGCDALAKAARLSKGIAAPVGNETEHKGSGTI